LHIQGCSAEQILNAAFLTLHTGVFYSDYFPTERLIKQRKSLLSRRVLGGLAAVTSTLPLASSPPVLVALGDAGGFTEDTFTKQTGLLT